MSTLAGYQVIQSIHATRATTPGEWARRHVRHGMADFLDWLGEPVGPSPDDRVPTMFLAADTTARGQMFAVVHPALMHQLRSMKGDA